jgi:zinc transporter, ZIP family
MNFYDWHPVLQALAGTLFTWFMTTAGAVPVLFTVRFNQKFFDCMLGLAAGVMIAASYWSLLAPAIEMSEHLGSLSWMPAAVGFVTGAVVLRIIDHLLPHLHPDLYKDGQAEGISSSWRRSTLLVLAITLHNFPEGLAVGVAFGAAAWGQEGATVAAAMALALGIGIQNFPEGLAVAMPLRREGMSRWRSLWYGQLSGTVEPIAGVLGAALVLIAQPILPYALAFAAGAMIFVVAEDLIPGAQRKGNVDVATMGVIVGFTVMMTLDVALG